MREIKFRGFGINNGQQFVGNLTILKAAFDLMEPGYYISNSAGAPFAYRVRPETVGQFTGLTDRNGKEIYEGDIVEHVPVGWVGGDFRRGVIGWSPSQGVIVNNWPLGLGVEVIGNIHQNPTLLKAVSDNG